MEINTILIIILTTLIIFSFNMVIGLSVGLFIYFKKKINNIDILVYELTCEGYQVSKKIGRFIIDPIKGKKLVSCGFRPNSIKDNFGYCISDNHMVPSKMGPGRKFVSICTKDGLSAPNVMNVENLNLSVDEKSLLNKIYSKNIKLAKLLENPKSLSLTPIKNEQLRFAMDVSKDAQEIYNDEDKRFGKTFMFLSLGVLAFAVIGAFVIIIIILTQAPSFAESMASNAVQQVSGIPPG